MRETRSLFFLTMSLIRRDVTPTEDLKRLTQHPTEQHIPAVDRSHAGNTHSSPTPSLFMRTAKGGKYTALRGYTGHKYCCPSLDEISQKCSFMCGKDGEDMTRRIERISWLAR